MWKKEHKRKIYTTFVNGDGNNFYAERMFICVTRNGVDECTRAAG